MLKKFFQNFTRQSQKQSFHSKAQTQQKLSNHGDLSNTSSSKLVNPRSKPSTTRTNERRRRLRSHALKQPLLSPRAEIERFKTERKRLEVQDRKTILEAAQNRDRALIEAAQKPLELAKKEIESRQSELRQAGKNKF